jgi:ketosteroid isomerase-like protein
MPDNTSDDILDAADRLFTAIENGDGAAVDRMWSADIAVWRTGGRRGPAKADHKSSDDKARALRVIDWFISATSQRSYEILDRQLFVNGPDRGFVQQHVLHATGHVGQSISLRVCIVIKLDNEGLISGIDEYFDPAELAPLLDQ